MKISIDHIRRMSVQERVDLVETLLDTIDDDATDTGLTDEQRSELDRRLEEYRHDPSTAKTWSEVREELEREE